MGRKGCVVLGCVRKHYANNMCSLHYHRVHRGNPIGGRGALIAAPGEPLAFVERASGSSTDECIIWPYGADRSDYPCLVYGGKMVRAARLMLELTVGVPPSPKHYACHAPVICHTPRCINPRHLRWATPMENSADKIADGTNNRPDMVHHAGEQNVSAKLSDDEVRAIRTDTRRQVDIAAAFGTTQTNVSRIKRRETWKLV